MSVLMPVPGCFDYMVLQYSLISGIMIPQTFFFFLKIAEAIWGLIWFHINFCSICSRSVKYVIGILTGIVLNLQIALGSVDILMMLMIIFVATVYGIFFFQFLLQQNLYYTIFLHLLYIINCYCFDLLLCLIYKLNFIIDMYVKEYVYIPIYI